MKAEARLLVVTVALTAFMSALLAQSVRERDSSWTAPAKDAAKSNPFADQPGVLAGGRKVYGQRCTTCHADEGHGTDRAPSLVAADVQTQSDGEIFWKITSGNTHSGMPSFSFLPDAQRWQLVLHLRVLASKWTGAR